MVLQVDVARRSPEWGMKDKPVLLPMSKNGGSALKDIYGDISPGTVAAGDLSA